jgi:penicillin-binding protein 1C
MSWKDKFLAVIKGRVKWVAIALILVIAYYFSLPKELFNNPYSTVLEAKSGELLSASIADDGQWRFPPLRNVPAKFQDALIQFEDKRFYNHPGIDPLSFGRAFKQNIKAGKIVSGGSTITMQVIRLSRKGRRRTVFEKGIELILATRLELKFSKDEILAMYASHAPFGGNVVGIEAACWRYFGRGETDLSWGEAALLAVLPNAPSLIHPGKNRDALKEKRDFLLEKLVLAGKIDSFTCSLAKSELIPEEPLSLPRHASHLLTRMSKEGRKGQKLTSSVNYLLQDAVEQIVQTHSTRLSGNQIHNAAVLVARVNSGEILAYVGNTQSKKNEGNDVDIIMAPRSTGSILKPFLYAALLDEGKLLPEMLLPDVPTLINGFAPKNFTREYDGAVPADKALIRSLNIPAVHMLREYRYERFYSLLKKLGMNSLTKPADHYGLSLILGGAEGTLWDISGMYASAARVEMNYFTHPGKNRYAPNDIHPLTYVSDFASGNNDLNETSALSAASVYLTFDALKELYRPAEESGWRYFESSKKIAWKTGTSFGFRDGWAVGVTPDYVVGVWVGNADGEGRPGLTGTDGAAPILFDVFAQLEGHTWFKKPKQEMQRITVCRRSGYRNSAVCPEVDTLWITQSGLSAKPCAYHRKVHLSPDKKFRVNSSCTSLAQSKEEIWFVLPPVQEHFFRLRNMSYKALPPFGSDCAASGNVHMMDLVYPKPDSKVFIPRDIMGNPGNAIFQLAHRNPKSVVFWHLDGAFIGSTQRSHHLPVNPASGKHTLLIIDERGEVIEQAFEVISAL